MKIILFLFKIIFHKRIRPYHIYAFIKYNNIKKLKNFILNEYERRQKKIFIKTKPYILYLEATNRCNYQCPFCPTGKHWSRISGHLNMTTLKKILDQLGNYIYMATLHGWGEPLLNQDLTKMISLLHERKIYTVMSTNVSLLSKDVSKQIIESKLDYLIAAIDGITPKSYNEYRVGGNINQVLNNLATFTKIKKELKSKTPYVDWQFVVFKNNENEIKEAKKIAKLIGIDRIEFIPGYIEDINYKIDKSKFKSRSSPLNKPEECKSLWSIATILWNGDIAACCWDYYGETGFGNIMDKNFEDIWNNKKFQESRKLIKYNGQTNFTNTICYLCIKNIKKESPNTALYDLKNK